MKMSLFLKFVFFLVVGNLSGQTEIIVAESTFKLNRNSEKTVQYGFCKGDQLIFDFEEKKGKPLKEIEIHEHKGSSMFMDFKSSQIKRKVINIKRTGIYNFRFSNSIVGKRVCRYSLKRIPSSEEFIDFNTTVYSKTQFDTTYITRNEKYLKSETIGAKTIIPTSEYFINSGTNALFKGGKSRITLPILLPSNTIEWYYEVAAFRNEEKMRQAKRKFSLVGNLTSLIDQSGAVNLASNLITAIPGSDYCDVYLMNEGNTQLFESKSTFSYSPIYSRKNITSGIVQIAGGHGDIIFLGIKNPDSYYGIHVVVEVVAIVKEQEWAIREINTPNIKKSKVYYLKYTNLLSE